MSVQILIDFGLLIFLVAVSVALAHMRDLFPAAMLTGLFSLLSASLFTVLHAPDVALTEAAVGAGVTTVLYLATLGLTWSHEKRVKPSRRLTGLAVTGLTGAALVYASLDMPPFGAADTPVHTHPIREKYLVESQEEVGIPNMVTAVLGSYRGYDTLGEVVVVFTAGAGVLVLLGRGRRGRKHGEE